MNTICKAKTYSHVAVHYRNAHEGPLAARLLREIGLTESYSAPQPDGNLFYHFVVDAQADRGIDRIFYMMCIPPQLVALYDEMHKALKVGQPDENPAVAALRDAQNAEPEFNFHVGIVVPSLEELEERTLRLQKLAAEDPELTGRIKVTINRSKPGDAEVDRRMDASPVFGSATRHTYGANGVQVFVETDIIAGGPLGDNWVFELDYVFPDRKYNMLNAPSPPAQAIVEKLDAA